MKMITVHQADQILKGLASSEKPRLCPIEKAIGRTLRQKIIADRPAPPFHRICMDGIAINHQAWEKGQRSFHIQETARAGQAITVLKDLQNCIEIMTGSPCPTNCDTNIRYEDLDINKGIATLPPDLVVKKGANIHLTGTDFQKGELLLSPGIEINPTHIAIAASVGLSHLEVSTSPALAVFSTGDELVDIDQIPAPHQIRKSNVHAIMSALLQNGFENTQRIHAQDELHLIQEALANALEQFQVLILSGGVSMGKFDFVPQALQNLGVKEHFHKVQHRPGKPLWVGESPGGQLVFGLPGNPVSALVCFRRYILPLLIAKSGLKKQDHTWVVLAKSVEFKPNLTYFLPVTLKSTLPTGWEATPKPTKGSGDFFSLGLSDGFIELPQGETYFEAGRSFKFYDWHYRI